MDRERLGPGNTYQEGAAEVREGREAEAVFNCHDTGARHGKLFSDAKHGCHAYARSKRRVQT